MSPEAKGITLLHKDGTSTPIGLDGLVEHLQKLDLRKRSRILGRFDDQTRPVFLPEHLMRWARFKIIEDNDTVVMTVYRGDGTFTHCHLSRSDDHPEELYLQVTSGLKLDESHCNKSTKDAEVHETFPLEIKIIGVGFSVSDEEAFIGFYGSDQKTGIRITQSGKVRFSSE